MNNDIYLTQEQLDKLKVELEFFIHERRPQVVARIKEAKSFGDLSENSEYDSAREEQAFVEAKIKELEAMIAKAHIISDKVDTDYISLGNTIKYKDLDSGNTFKYKIVGVGADPLDKKNPSISSSGPIAKNLLGKKKGDKISVDVPAGKVNLQVLEIK